MVALTITAANVAWVSGPISKDQVAGEAFAAGDLVYRSTSGTWLKAQCDGTPVEAGSGGLGLALFTADAAGARGSVARGGAIVDVGTGTAGVVYHPGATAGDLIPTADLLSTNKVSIAALGIGSNDLLLLEGYNAGAVLA